MMNLYRIDLHDAATGAHIGRATDILGPTLDRSWKTARERAIRIAQARSVQADIMRITGCGDCKIIARIDPSGRVARVPSKSSEAR
jgi:hypothetical protein